VSERPTTYKIEEPLLRDRSLLCQTPPIFGSSLKTEPKSVGLVNLDEDHYSFVGAPNPIESHFSNYSAVATILHLETQTATDLIDDVL
jgi:hypothetical protein